MDKCPHEDRLQALDEKLDRVLTLLDGGDDASKGFIVRLDRIERVVKACGLVLGGLATAAGAWAWSAITGRGS